MTHPDPKIDREIVISAYNLSSGFGYVWIIRIFLIIALVTPLLIRITARWNWPTTLLAATALTYLNSFTPSLGELPAEVVGYCICAFVGISARKMRPSIVWTIGSIGIIIYSITMMTSLHYLGKIPILAQLKYPPGPLYLCYGVGAALFLLGVANRVGPRFRDYSENASALWARTPCGSIFGI